MTGHERREDECWEMSESSAGNASALWAIAAGMFAVSSATAYAARHLGTGNAATQMGALEALAKEVQDGMISIADAIRSHGE